MKVLIACEFSGTVREAFNSMGHDAWSCDLLPTEKPGNHHQGDIRDFINTQQWDLMIAHPPCTRIANSGVHWLARRNLWEEMKEGARFFKSLLDANIPMIAVENPIPHKYALEIIERKYDQIIQPFQFGHPESKQTCLWLKGLAKLSPTDTVEPPHYTCKCGHTFESKLGKYGCPNCEGDNGAARPMYSNQTPSGRNNLPPSPTRWMERSRTYPGIAKAMAQQWGAEA